MTTKAEKALSLRTFMKMTGTGYSVAKKMWDSPGFPAIAGKIFWSDFVIWRRRRMEAMELSQNLQTPPNPPLDAGHTACGSTRMNDSRAALPPRAERLLAGVS